MSTIYMIVTVVNNQSYVKRIAYKDEKLANDIADKLKISKKYDKVEVLELDLRD
jgi:hypothetical protein